MRRSAISVRSALCLLSGLLVLPEAGLAQQQAAPKAAARSSLEEVVVTARRRSESLQETPIAVTALSGEDLQDRGIVNVQELTKSVPSLEITESVANLIYIRGIGQRTAFARVDPTVGVYLDNIFLPRADGQLLDTIDVQNIQVLRGPQGTLFGKNTTGGAMVMTLEKPTDARESYVSATLGSYNRRGFRAATNIPLSDSVYTRFAYNYIKDDGFFEDISRDDRGMSSKDRQSYLAQLRWEISADMLFDSLAYYGKMQENLAGTNCRIANDDALFLNGLYLLWPGDTDPQNLTAYRENCESNSEERLGDLKNNLGFAPQTDKDLDTILLAGTLDWSVTETLDIKLVGGARAEKKGPVQTSDQDGGPANFNESHNTGDSDRRSYSLELQFNGTLFEDAVTYTAGLFGMYETNTEQFGLTNSLNGLDPATLAQIAGGQEPTAPTQTTLSNGLVGILVDPILISEFELENLTLAAFFQGSWDITEQLELTLGIRWTSETRSSELEVFAADRVAIESIMQMSGLFSACGARLDGRASFCTSNQPWALDPISDAMALFPDRDGDGIHDFPMVAGPVRTDDREETFSKVTPMMSLSYQVPEAWLDDSFIDTAMVYGTWSFGFKSGFFEPKGVDGLQQVDPEEVENREIGFKFEAFDRSLRFNIAFYDMDFTDQQVINVDADSGNNLVVVFENAGSSSITGVEMELQWMPSPGLMVNLSASDNTYEFQEFNDNDLLQQVLGNPTPIDRSDEPFAVSPEQTFSFGIQQSFPFVVGTITPRLDYSYKSDVYFGLDDGSYDAYQRDEGLTGQDAYEVLDFRLTWASDERDMMVAFFVKNVLDERYQVGISGVADSVGTHFRTYGEPRMFGIEARREFY